MVPLIDSASAGPQGQMPGGQLYRWDFTYFLPKDEGDTKTEPVDYAVKIQQMLDRYCKQYIFQCERTPTTDRLHMQGYLNLTKKITKDSLGRMFGLHMPGVSVRPASDAGTEALKTYCMKSDTRVAGPWKDHKASQTDKEKPTLWDVPVVNGDPLFRWQQTIYDEVKDKCYDNRTINWVVDLTGRIGKSSLAKYLYHTLGIPILPYAKASDLVNFVYEHCGKLAYFFDLNRTKPTDFTSNDIYSTLETIKNGMIFNGKYKTGIKMMDPPHVWVFANFCPNVQKLTNDRWKIWEVLNKKLHPYTAPESILTSRDVPPEKAPLRKF